MSQGSGNLRTRIEAIVMNRVGGRISPAGRLLLTSFAIATLAVPIRLEAQASNTTRQTSANAAAAGPTFEVATVKPNDSGDGRQFTQRQPGGRVTVFNMPVRGLITYSYQMAPFQIVGGPRWTESDRFDILAKLQGNPDFVPGAGPDPIQLAMRSLLADRFGLTFHRETREMDIYALVMAKPGGVPGPGLERSTRDCRPGATAGPRGQGASTGQSGAPGLCGIMSNSRIIRFGGLPISDFANVLGDLAGRVVVDRTGLTGNWDFELVFEAVQRNVVPAAAPPAADPSAASLFTALQEQLGLKLESTRGPVDVLVLDDVKKPTPDK